MKKRKSFAVPRKPFFTAGLLVMTLVLSLVLVSCGDGALSGTYASEREGSPNLRFSGDKVTFIGKFWMGMEAELSAAYRIEDSAMTVAFERSDFENAFEGFRDLFEITGQSLDELVDESMRVMGEQYEKIPFSQQGDTITLGGEVFIKQPEAQQ